MKHPHDTPPQAPRRQSSEPLEVRETNEQPRKDPESGPAEGRVNEPGKAPEAKVIGTATWLGEGDGGPRENTWDGKTFKVGEAVEITDPRILDKAKANRFYKVDDRRPDKPAEKPE